MEQEVSLEFYVKAGMFRRKQAREGVERYCRARGIKCEVVETSTWSQSVYAFKVTGTRDALISLKDFVSSWMETRSE